MSIHKTKSGTFEVRWREQGKQKSKTFKRRVDAKKFEAQINAGIDALGLSKSETLEVGLSFKEFSEIWMRDHSLVHNAESTVIRNRQILKKHLIPKIGEIELSSLSVTTNSGTVDSPYSIVL